MTVLRFATRYVCICCTYIIVPEELPLFYTPMYISKVP